MWRWGLRVGVLAVVVWAAVATVMSERREAERTSRLEMGNRQIFRTTTTVDDTGLAGGRHEVGQCLKWEQGARSDVIVAVPCEEPHVLEVTGHVTLPTEPAVYPDGAGWSAVMSEHCGPVAAAYLGRPLDPYGRLALQALHPRADAWARGDRDYWCGLGAANPARLPEAEAPLKTGPAKGADQAFLWPTGACVTLEPWAAVPCEQPHRYEVTGVVDLSGRRSEPSAGQWDEIGWSGECVQRAAEYLGRPFSTEGGLGSMVLRLDPASWAAGTRRVNCVIGRSDGTGTPVDSTGSLKG